MVNKLNCVTSGDTISSIYLSPYSECFDFSLKVFPINQYIVISSSLTFLRALSFAFVIMLIISFNSELVFTNSKIADELEVSLDWLIAGYPGWGVEEEMRTAHVITFPVTYQALRN